MHTHIPGLSGISYVLSIPFSWITHCHNANNEWCFDWLERMLHLNCWKIFHIKKSKTNLGNNISTCYYIHINFIVYEVALFVLRALLNTSLLSLTHPSFEVKAPQTMVEMQSQNSSRYHSCPSSQSLYLPNNRADV